MTHAQDWTPPDHPDADAILNESVDDARAGRYEVALAKHLWFHANALSCDPGLSGVRLSFALGYWRDLAEEYRPAMEKLVEVRQRAESDFRQSGFLFDAFLDLSNLNRVLDEKHKTAEAFLVADENDPKAAAKIYHVAQRVLVASHQYEICGKYLEPTKRLDALIRGYHLSQKCERKWASSLPNTPATARLRFVNEVTTLVALLVKNQRADEAQRVASLALGELSDREFKEELDSALAGNVPQEWP